MFARTRTVGLALALAFGASGCTMQVRGTATGTAPALVQLEGDVWVVENYDEPVFYTDNYYWRYSGGGWYRSNVYNQGWLSVTVVPDGLRRIDQPTRYVRYTAPANAQKRIVPGHQAPARGLHDTQPGHQNETARDHDKDKDKGPKHR